MVCVAGETTGLAYNGPMKCFEESFDEPALNLACDEALLELAERGVVGACLRFWESPVRFVVLGVSQVAAAEADLGACEAAGVRVLRRCSAGGCVLQGPGCLNFSLVLDARGAPGLGTIRESYCTILTRIRDGLRGAGVAASLEGTSDLAVSGLKFSGNAQRRKKRFILHHGTLLYDFDLGVVSRFLREPEVRPEYRAARTHDGFLMNVPLGRGRLMELIRETFPGAAEMATLPVGVAERAEELAAEKYREASWNLRR